MTHDTQYQVQQRQHQKQRQQQQQQEQQRNIVPGSQLPEKEHQSKHNPVSETLEGVSHSCDQ